MTNGLVHQRTPWTSTSPLMVAMAPHARRAQKSTYELVQIPLLIGKDQFHINPAIMPNEPPANMPLMRSVRGFSAAIQRPVSTPSIAVPIAGIVERIPSGSQVTLPDQR